MPADGSPSDWHLAQGPSIDGGLARLWRLDRYGVSPRAFTFKSRFPAPGLVGGPKDMRPDPWCVGRA